MTENREMSIHYLGTGFLWAAGGTLFTDASYYSVSDSGGRYFIFYGAIIYGILNILRGLWGLLVGELDRS